MARHKQTDQNTTGTSGQQGKVFSIPVPERVAREMRIEKAHVDQDMKDLVALAWDFYKTHHPQPWRV